MKILGLSLALCLLVGCTSSPEAGSFEILGMSAGVRDPKLTPGKLCTQQDLDFKGFRYAEKIPYCERDVSLSLKKKWGVFTEYPFINSIILSSITSFL